MKVGLNWILKDLSGKEMQGEEEAVHAGKLIANLFSRASDTETPVKFLDWALKLYKNQPIEVDSDDLSKIKRFVKEHKGLFNIAKGQVLKALDQVKESEAVTSK